MKEGIGGKGKEREGEEWEIYFYLSCSYQPLLNFKPTFTHRQTLFYRISHSLPTNPRTPIIHFAPSFPAEPCHRLCVTTSALQPLSFSFEKFMPRETSLPMRTPRTDALVLLCTRPYIPLHTRPRTPASSRLRTPTFDHQEHSVMALDPVESYQNVDNHSPQSHEIHVVQYVLGPPRPAFSPSF